MEFLRNRLHALGKIPAKQIPAYVRWVSRCHRFCGQSEDTPLNDHQVADFLSHVASDHNWRKTAEAGKAMAMYRAIYHQIRIDADSNRWRALLIRFRHVARLKGFAPAFVESLAEHLRSFLDYWPNVAPDALVERHAMLYLSHLSGKPESDLETVDKAYTGLSLFYLYVLHRELRHFVHRSAGWYHGQDRRKAS